MSRVAVAVGPEGVAVDGTGVALGTAVDVGGTGVALGETGAAVSEAANVAGAGEAAGGAVPAFAVAHPANTSAVPKITIRNLKEFFMILNIHPIVS